MAFTFFFRDLPILQTAADLLVQETMGRSRVRVWDAGCAMGQEPYTLLMLLAERMGRFSFQNLTVDATDIDEGGDFGTIIDKGEYPWDQVQRIPPELLNKYFKPKDEAKATWIIDEKIRERIRFKRHDLISLKAQSEGYALIICKNVLLHFTAEQRLKVIGMFYDCLAQGGFLVTEHTQKLPVECAQMFETVVPDAQIFKKKNSVAVLAV